MFKKIKSIFNMKGSWGWACKKMEEGLTIYRTTDTGTARYKLDNEGQRRIMWAYARVPDDYTFWENANIFISDFTCTDWDIFSGKPVPKGQRRW